MAGPDANTLAALAKPSTIVRNLLWIAGKDGGGSPASFGFWDGVGDVTVSVPAAGTGTSTSRLYWGDEAIISVPVLAQKIGLMEDTYDFVLDLLHSRVETMVRGNDIRQARVELHRALFNVDGSGMVSTPVLKIDGLVDSGDRETGLIGEQSEVTLSVVTNTDLTKVSTAMKSDQNQRLRSGDRGRRISARAPEINRVWGEYRKQR